MTVVILPASLRQDALPKLVKAAGGHLLNLTWKPEAGSRQPGAGSWKQTRQSNG